MLTPLDRTTVRVDAGKLVRERLDVLILQIAHSVSDRARIEDRPDAKWPLSPLDLFVSNLVDMFVAALVGPRQRRDDAGLAAACVVEAREVRRAC